MSMRGNRITLYCRIRYVFTAPPVQVSLLKASEPTSDLPEERKGRGRQLGWGAALTAKCSRIFGRSRKSAAGQRWIHDGIGSSGVP